MPSYYCQICGKEIRGRGKKLHHPEWSRKQKLRVCKDCFKNKPRCSICDITISETTPHGICATCASSTLFCLACNQPIEGEHVEIEGVGSYCQTCCREREPCDVCSAPLTDERWRLSDGRTTCAHCHATAIYEPGEAAGLYSELKEVAFLKLGLKLNIPTGLALVDRSQLAKIIERQLKENHNNTPSEELDPNKTLGIYARRGIRRGIYVQNGLPRTLLLQIASHEFAHAWQGENCPMVSDRLEHEGFAEWVAYKILDQYGYSNQQNRMRSRSDIYGQGLNWALEIEAQGGIRGVIESCRSAK